MAKFDDLDIKIIRELKWDSRQSYRDIARKLEVAEGTVYNRINKMREGDLIKGFMVDIDYSKLGYDLTALIGITTEGGSLQEVEQEISKEPSISALYDVTGEYDALLVAKFKDREGLNNLVKKLLAMPEIKRTYTMVVLNVVKEEHGINV
ncbi:MAG: Lrp/AsnC family transcriptional regulator [Candidatus Altiarchaeota archaeon]